MAWNNCRVVLLVSPPFFLGKQLKKKKLLNRLHSFCCLNACSNCMFQKCPNVVYQSIIPYHFYLNNISVCWPRKDLGCFFTSKYLSFVNDLGYMNDFWSIRLTRWWRFWIFLKRQDRHCKIVISTHCTGIKEIHTH